MRERSGPISLIMRHVCATLRHVSQICLGADIAGFALISSGGTDCKKRGKLKAIGPQGHAALSESPYFMYPCSLGFFRATGSVLSAVYLPPGTILWGAARVDASVPLEVRWP